MCLNSITQTFRGPNDKMEIGYKVFRRSRFLRGLDDPAYYNLYFKSFIDHYMGSRYEAEIPVISQRAKDEKLYMPYFHMFYLEEDARGMLEYIDPEDVEHYSVCEVFAWDIRVIGTQGRGIVGRLNERVESPCFIAKNYRLMRDCREVKNVS